MTEIAYGPFAGFIRNKYQVIYADPPWDYKVRSEKGEDRSAKQHYKVMSLRDIKRLPVRQLAAKNCILFMWVTDTHFEMGFDVIRAWGFKFKTVGFHWVKLNRDGTPFTGMGHWTRANPEICLLATKGAPSRVERDVRRLIMSERREHSRKPDEAYDRIEALAQGPYIELFARTKHPGWDAWGNQTGRFLSLPKRVLDILG